MDSPLRGTVHEILLNVHKFHILVVGKSGCGKSELLGKVFGVDVNQEHRTPSEGKDSVAPKIQGVTFPENDKLILFTSSPDFSPNSDTDYDAIKDFIQHRLGADDEKRIHAIWICMDTPRKGERLNESGVERLLQAASLKVPIIIVLTKFDQLVASNKSAEQESTFSGDGEVDKAREDAEQLLDDTLKKVSLDSLLSQQLVTPVSTNPGFEDTVSTLIQSTDGAIQKLLGKRTHDSPTALAWAIAQRQDLGTKVAAVIDVGAKRYWKGLGNSTDFKGKTLEQCVSVIHDDITAIWNVQGGSNYIAGDDFKARVSHLVEDLANINQSTIPASHGLAPATFVAATANPIAAIGAVAEAAKWVSDVYQMTRESVACIMGYIVDLIMALTFLSESNQFTDSIEEDTVSAIKGYVSESKLFAQVHDDIRKFVKTHKLDETTGHEDVVRTEIIRLVKKYPRSAKEVVKTKAFRKASAPSISLPPNSPTDSTDNSMTRESQPNRLSVKTRLTPRRGAQERSPDILSIVEEATKTPISLSRSPSEGVPRPTLLVPERSSQDGAGHHLNPLNWIRRDHHAADEETGKA